MPPASTPLRASASHYAWCMSGFVALVISGGLVVPFVYPAYPRTYATFIVTTFIVVTVTVRSALVVPSDFFLDCSWVEARLEELGSLELDMTM